MPGEVERELEALNGHLRRLELGFVPFALLAFFGDLSVWVTIINDHIGAPHASPLNARLRMSNVAGNDTVALS